MAEGVQSLNRALGILETLASSNQGLGITELSKRVNLPASTIHRLLSTLGRKGYVAQLSGEKYHLGLKLVELARNFLESFQLQKIVRPFLEEICEQTEETANLVILDSNEAFYLDKVDSPRSLRVFSKIGHRAPLYCTGCGKVLLAGFPGDRLERYLREGELKPLTKNTITSRAALRKELARVRAQGRAYDWEECEIGARCAAVPIKAFGDRVIAALSVSGPAVRLNEKELERAADCLQVAALKIAGQIG